MGVATTLGAISVAGGIAKAVSGSKQKRDAKRAARNFRRQELKNYSRERRISTEGAELALEEMQRGTAATTAALSAGGVRGVVGGAGAVQAANNTTARQIGASLDEQQVALDRDIAAEDERIRAIQENRDYQELSAIQGQVNAGNEQMWGGIGDVAQGVGGLANAGVFGGTTPTTTTPGVTAQGVPDAKPGLGSVFGVTNPIFTARPINPVTGQPYRR